MARAMRRAAIPAWVTEGFNPHLFLTFALPLSLGQEGLDESMDIKLADDAEIDDIPAKLNATLPAGLEVTHAAIAVAKPAAIASAVYEITLTPQPGDPAELAEKWTAFLAQPHIPVIKKGKSGEREIDLRPCLLACDTAPVNGGVHSRLRLPAGSSENVNPSLLLDAFAAQSGLAFYPQVVRTAVLDAAGKKFA